MKEYVARFGHGTAKLARQGESSSSVEGAAAAALLGAPPGGGDGHAASRSRSGESERKRPLSAAGGWGPSSSCATHCHALRRRRRRSLHSLHRPRAVEGDETAAAVVADQRGDGVRCSIAVVAVGQEERAPIRSPRGVCGVCVCVRVPHAACVCSPPPRARSLARSLYDRQVEGEAAQQEARGRPHGEADRGEGP